MATANTYIGRPISLISQSDIRYCGILASIDPAASTIQLSDVYSMGTESRRPVHEFIPPVPRPYEYIVFRANEVKDIAVDNFHPSVSQQPIHNDPAILGSSGPTRAPLPQPTYPPSQQQIPQRAPPSQAAPASQQQPSVYTNGAINADRGVQNANVSLQNVERALADSRQQSASSHHQQPHHGGGRRNNNRNQTTVQTTTPLPGTDFDFQSSNARFDKAALKAQISGTDGNADSSDSDAGVASPTPGDEKEAYNPNKSFFDDLSPGANPAPPPNARGGGGGRDGKVGAGRSRREEERQKNMSTFGEPGGVGLLGPGAYVGGGGGHGRRGGRGGRGRGRTSGGQRQSGNRVQQS